jgi:hypothetical protein
MPRVLLTLLQHEDAIGLPIIILEAMDRTTGKPMQLMARDLPVTAIAVILGWLNDRLSTP